MSTRLENHQLDLLHRAASQADRGKLPLEIQEALVGLVKQLLGECIRGPVNASSIDE